MQRPAASSAAVSEVSSNSNSGTLVRQMVEAEANRDVKLSLKVVVNKQKTKVLFAKADNKFADVLFSFLTLPLGTIVRILKQHFGDEAPVFGSLTSLYNGLSKNLPWYIFFNKKDAKSILMHPRSSSDAQCMRLQLDISDSHPPEYFVCTAANDCSRRFQSVSVYHDEVKCCCLGPMKIEASQKDITPTAWFSCIVITLSDDQFFLIADDLKILSNNSEELMQSITSGKAETIHFTFGFAEIMDLLKASLISSTPLSDVILKKKGARKSSAASTTKKYHASSQIGNDASSDSNAKKMNLKLMIQKSTNKLLCAEAEEDFVEFLFSFLVIPLGGVEHLLANDSSIESIDNLYRSIDDLNVKKYFKNPAAKNSLINPKIVHGYVSENHILPLVEECLPASYQEYYWHSSNKFPRGKGTYLKERGTSFQVTDDLTVTPFCHVSMISSFNKMKIPLSDVKVMQQQIGLEEALGILRASLTSTTALTDGLNLTNRTSNKRPRKSTGN